MRQFEFMISAGHVNPDAAAQAVAFLDKFHFQFNRLSLYLSGFVEVGA